MRRRLISSIGLFLLLLVSAGAWGAGGNSAQPIDLEFKDVEIVDVLRATAIVANVNIVSDSTLSGRISVKLKGATLDQALSALAQVGKCRYKQEGGVYFFSRDQFAESPTITIDSSGRVTVRARDAVLRDLLLDVSKKSGLSVAPSAGLDDKISVELDRVSSKDIVPALAKAGGVPCSLQNGIWYVGAGSAPIEADVVEVDPETRVTVHVRDAGLRDLLLDVSKKAGLSIVPSAGMTEKVSVALDRVPAKEVVQALAKAGGVPFKEESGVYYVGHESPPPQEESPGGGSKPVVNASGVVSGAISDLSTLRDSGLVSTRVFKLNYLKASDALEYLSKPAAGSSPTADPPPVIRATKEQNIIIATGTEASLAAIEDELKQIDIPAPQVMLEVKVAEVYTSKDRSLGLLLGQFSNGKISLDTSQGQLVYASSGFTTDLKATLQLLVQNGYGKVLASPSICAITGHEATIDIGQVRYFRISSLDSGQQSGGQASPYYYPFSTLQTINAGMSLKITPWVGANGDITADIEPEVSSVTGITSEGLPELNRRKARTCIRVRNGDTIIIGGLKQQDNTKSVQKTPLLGDLPVIGQLFRSTKALRRESELLIFITAKIMTGDTAAVQGKSTEPVEPAPRVGEK